MIKTAATTLALAITVSTASAQQAPTLTMEQCDNLHGLASEVMIARQSGRSLQDVIQATDNNAFVRRMARIAWERPRYSTERYQQQEVTDFADQWYSQCLSQLQEDE